MDIQASSSRISDPPASSSLNLNNVLLNASSQASTSNSVAGSSKSVSTVAPKNNDEKNRKLYLTVYKFLQQQLNENHNLNAVQKESLEVIVNCLGYAFQFFDFDYVEHSLPKIYDFFEKHKQDSKKKQQVDPAVEREISPEDIVRADSFKEKGNKLMREEKFVEALECYEKAVRFNPKEPALYCNRAAAYNNLNRFNDAIDDCNAALSLNSSYAKAYVRRGLAYEKLKDNKHALKSYKKAYQLEPDNEHYKNMYVEASKRFKQKQDESTSTSNTSSFNMFLGPNMSSLPFGQLPEFNNLMESLFSNVERQWQNEENPPPTDPNNRDNPSYFS